MGIKVKFAQNRVPDDAAGWSRALRDVPVQPSDKSVTPDTLAVETVNFIGDKATESANTAIGVHVADSNPHAQYATQVALNGHTVKANPHPNLFGITKAEDTAGISSVDGTYRPGDVLRHGADPTGTSDSVPAINAAISQAVQSGGRIVRLPAGILLIASKVSVPASITLVGEGPQTVIKKGFNGDMIEVASFAGLRDLDLHGNSSSYSGRGVIITAGTNPSGGRQHFRGVRIYSMRSYCVEYTADGAGFLSSWNGCEFSVANNDIVCIKLPTDTSTGNRRFIDCSSHADSLIDIGGSANTQLVGCASGRSSVGSLAPIIFGSSSAQAIISGCRIAGGGVTTSIKGQTHTITGCTWAGNLEFGAGCVNSKFVANQREGSGVTIADNSGSSGSNANEFDTTIVPYSPTWTGATSNPSLGNGSLNGSYTRRGRVVTQSFRLTIGSTTTFGSGSWRFSLPFTAANRSYLGTAKILDSGTEIMNGFAQIDEGSATFFTVYGFKAGVATAVAVNATTPMTWATGDELWVTITYDA